MPEHKLDIFDALAAMDRKQGDWLSEQPEESRKGFAPPVFLRWASAIAGDGLAGEYTLCMVNERVNMYANELMAQHPDLLFRLAASCGIGSRQRHEWIPMTKKGGGSANKARELLASFHPSANDMEIDILMSKFTRDTFKAFTEEAGITSDECREALKAYDKLFGKPTESKPKKKGKG